MCIMHKNFSQRDKVNGNYEKQVKVRGQFRPLTNDIGRQSRPGCNGFSDFGQRGHFQRPYNMHKGNGGIV